MAAAATPRITTLSRPPGDDTCVVAMRGEIDMANAAELTARARKALMAGAERLRMNLSEITFMDVSGVHALLAAGAAAARYGTPFEVVAPAGPVRRVLALTGAASRLAPSPR
jgi:anti-anti-sigma factor